MTSVLQTTFVTKQDAILAGIGTTQISAADKVRALDSALARYSSDQPKAASLDFVGDGTRYYLLNGAVVSVEDSTQDAGIDLTSGAVADSQLGVSFTLPYRMTIDSVRLLLRRIGSPAGTVACQIRYANGVVPAASIAVTSNSLTSLTDLPLDYAAGKTEFVFAAPVTLNAGTYYAVIVTSGYTYSSGVTEIDLGVDQSSVTNSVFTFNGAVTWAAYGTASAGVIEVLAHLPGWYFHWSTLKAPNIPAPSISSDQVPIILEDEDYTTYDASGNEYLYLPNHAPDSTQTIRLYYGSRYLFAGSPLAADVPAAHFEAVVTLSAYFACTWLAARYGQNVDPGLGADIADRRNQSDVYASRAKEFLTQYESMLGVGDEATSEPLAHFGDVDRGTYSGRDFIYHPRRQR